MPSVKQVKKPTKVLSKLKEPHINEKMRKIDSILTGLTLQIGNSKTLKSSKAKATAKTLLKSLSIARDQLFDSQNDGMDETDAGVKFIKECNAAIQTASPVLEQEMAIGDYLKSIVIWLANIVIAGCNKLGMNITFFPPVKSKSTQAIQTAMANFATEIITPLPNAENNTEIASKSAKIW